MINESLTIGLLLAVVFGGICFYLYTRVVYTEKRISLMENILLDIKMAQEQKPLHVLPPIPNEVSFQDTVARNTETYQNSNLVEHDEMLEQNLEETLKETLEELPNFENEEDTTEYTELLNQVSTETVVPQETVKNNYDSMSKDELLELVKKRGLRAGNRPGREKLISLLEKADETAQSVQPVETNVFSDLQEAVTE